MGPVPLVIVNVKRAKTEAPLLPLFSHALMVMLLVVATVGVPPIFPLELVNHRPGVRGKTALPLVAVLALQECAV